MKRILTVLLAIALVIGVIPVVAGAETAAPEIKKVNMTLGGILGINFKVDAKGTDLSGCSIRVTLASDGAYQTVTDYVMEGNLYVYTAKLPAHKIHETLTVELLSGGDVIQTKTDWSIASYLNDLKSYNPDNAELAELAEALLNYGTYAAYYQAPAGDAPSIQAVESVTREALSGYKYQAVVKNGALGAVAGLYIDDACDLRVKFDLDAWDGNTLFINGSAVSVTEAEDKVVYEITQLLPQKWNDLYNIKVLDEGGSVVYEINYAVLSYAYLSLGNADQSSLNGLLKAMYLYQEAAEAYIAADNVLIENGPIDEGDGPVIEF